MNAKKIVIFALAFFVDGCKVRSLSELRDAGSPDLAIHLVPEGVNFYLEIGVVKEATAFSVTSVTPAETKNIVMLPAKAPLPNGRHIFRSQELFVPNADAEVTIQATTATGPYVRKVRFYVDSANGVALLGTANRRFTVVGSDKDGLSNPRDLEFNPARPTELWTVNEGFEGVVIYHDAGTATQRIEKKADAWGLHFMAKVSSIAFNEQGLFATCHESRNEARELELGGAARDFMGPTLWPSDPKIFAAVNQNRKPGGVVCEGTNRDGELQGSHLDMIHQSPLCMGVAHVSANQFWVFDGHNGNLVNYDFVQPHEPGGEYHGDGLVGRYEAVKLDRVEKVPSHMVVDKTTGILYIANTGAGTILKVDAKNAQAAGKLTPKNENLVKYEKMQGEVATVFAQGLKHPSGIVLADGKIFVSDHATGEIIAYNLEGKELGRITTTAKGIMGLTVSPTNQLWYVDGASNTLVRIDP